MGMYTISCETEKCSYEFEFLGNYENLQKALKKKCPKCNNKALFQEMVKMNFKLMGTGWADANYKQIVDKVKKPIKGLDD